MTVIKNKKETKDLVNKYMNFVVLVEKNSSVIRIEFSLLLFELPVGSKESTTSKWEHQFQKFGLFHSRSVPFFCI